MWGAVGAGQILLGKPLLCLGHAIYTYTITDLIFLARKKPLSWRRAIVGNCDKASE